LPRPGWPALSAAGCLWSDVWHRADAVRISVRAAAISVRAAAVKESLSSLSRGESEKDRKSDFQADDEKLRSLANKHSKSYQPEDASAIGLFYAQMRIL